MHGFNKEFVQQGSNVAILLINEVCGTCKTNIWMALKSKGIFLAFSIWWKCPFALSKMPFYIPWQNALFQNALFKRGILNKSSLSRNTKGNLLKSKRAFQISTLQMPSYTTWQNALTHNVLFERAFGIRAFCQGL